MFYFCTFARETAASVKMLYFSAVFSVDSRIQNPVARMLEAVDNEFLPSTLIMSRVIQPDDYQSLLKMKHIRRFQIELPKTSTSN